MRIVLRLVCVLVMASAAITVWTRTALVFVLGPQLTGVCVWIAAGGSLCAVITLAWTRNSARRRQHKPPELPAGYVARVGRDGPLPHDRPGNPLTGAEPGMPRDMQATRPGGNRVG